jgi:hypothetical protein
MAIDAAGSQTYWEEVHLEEFAVMARVDRPLTIRGDFKGLDAVADDDGLLGSGE